MCHTGDDVSAHTIPKQGPWYSLKLFSRGQRSLWFRGALPIPNSQRHNSSECRTKKKIVLSVRQAVERAVPPPPGCTHRLLPPSILIYQSHNTGEAPQMQKAQERVSPQNSEHKRVFRRPWSLGKMKPYCTFTCCQQKISTAVE